jgi:ParB/RepB/Spo0J family partition protein
MITSTVPTVDADQAVVTVPIERLVPNPLNPRTRLGDLAELTRSIKTHGVLQPLLVLPAGSDGSHVVVAGHRRHAAATAAGIELLPVVVRDLSEAEQIEVALAENANRDDLDLADEIAAIERLMSLDGGLTPARLSKRIGKSQAWVRDRMTVTILPARWRAKLTDGTLTLAAANAAASVADLGPEHIDTVCEQLTGKAWRDPKQTVDDYRRDLRRTAAYDSVVDKHRRAGTIVFTDDDPLPTSAKRLRDLGLDGEQADAHTTEPCHAVLVARGWGEKPTVEAVCTEPRRHRPTRTGGTPVSPVVTESHPHTSGDDSYAKRQGRAARLAYGTEVFARRRGGPTATELTALALPVLIDLAGADVLGHATRLLGIDGDRPHQALRDLAAESPAALARVAGAVACGIAETWAYQSTGPTVAGWFRLLVDHGWEPDGWTTDRITTIPSAGDQS